MDVNGFLERLRADLAAAADPAHREGSRNFFKEEIRPLGVRAADLGPLEARGWRAVKTLPRAALWDLCGRLWASEVFEEGALACKWAGRLVPKLTASDFEVLEGWMKDYVGNWAHCDVLCTHAVGGCVFRFPELAPRLLRWTASDNRWLRRGAAVSLIFHAKRGAGLDQALRTAEALEKDDDDLVQKGYGWLLKEMSVPFRQEVFDWLMARRTSLPRTAFRYALEKMPPELRRLAMRK